MSCFSDLCRLCAGKIDGLLCFNLLSPDHHELLKKLMISLPIQVSPEDHYPKYICMECAYKVDMLYEFRERCLITDQLFQDMIVSDDVLNIAVGSAPFVITEQVAGEAEKGESEIISLDFNSGQFIITQTETSDCNTLLPVVTESLAQYKPDDPGPKVVVVENEVANFVPETESSTKPLDEKPAKTQSGTVRVCGDCGKVFSSKYKLLEHVRRHTGEKPFACSNTDCTRSFRSKIGLAQHEAGHSGNYELKCWCGKGFQCKSYLKVHQRVHSTEKPFSCQQCPQTFKSKQSLTDHINRHLGVKPYLCDICGRGFITKGLCKSHQRTHTGQDNRQHPCNICRKLFVSKSYLRVHFKIHTGEKPFMCETCGKSFLTAVDLKIHSTMHTGEKRFVCETCGKAFARRDALRCHRRSHTGERPYKCEYCGQNFSQFSPMAIHKRLHTGERPYPCEDCPKAFISKSNLSAHRKKNHEITLKTTPTNGKSKEKGK